MHRCFGWETVFRGTLHFIVFCGFIEGTGGGGVGALQNWRAQAFRRIILCVYVLDEYDAMETEK